VSAPQESFIAPTASASSTHIDSGLELVADSGSGDISRIPRHTVS
jgi:hypothetical protein